MQEKPNPPKISFPKVAEKQKTIYVGDDADLHEAAEHLRNTYKRKSQARFDLAFGAVKEFKRCKKSCRVTSFYDFIEKLLYREKNLPWKFNSFKQGYAIVKAFSDLKRRSNRKLFYSHYRAIANADLKQLEKYVVRRTFEKIMEEEGKVTIADIKRLLKKKYKIGSHLEEEKVITYYTKKQFLRKIGEMVSGYKEIRDGTKVNVVLRVVRQTRDEKKKLKNKILPPKISSTFSIRS